MRILLAAIATCVALVLAPLAGAATAATLEGRSFDVDLKKPDGKTDKDTLIFTATDADSIACHAFGFGKGPVTYTDDKGQSVGFAFNTKDGKGGLIEWKGTVKGSSIEGTAVLTMDNKPQNMEFKGHEAKGDKDKKDEAK